MASRSRGSSSIVEESGSKRIAGKPGYFAASLASYSLTMKPIRMLLIDDHALIRAGIRAVLEEDERVEVVGEAGDGSQVVDLIEKLKPDVVLLDLTMPGLSGFEVLKTTSEKFPEVRMIVLTVHEEEEYAFRALRSGAAGYLPKSAASAELRMAIEHVMSGRKYLSPSIVQRAAFEFGRDRYDRQTTPAELTPRQREVLTLIADGHSTKDIALTLNISAKTVESHRTQLMDRLNIHDIASLVRYAIKMGLVSIEERSPLKKSGAGGKFILPIAAALCFLPDLLRLFLS